MTLVATLFFGGEIVIRILHLTVPMCIAGDRPIEITLQRAWASLSWRQRLQVLNALWQSQGQAADISAEAVEAMKDDDVISSVLAEYSATFPEVLPCAYQLLYKKKSSSTYVPSAVVKHRRISVLINLEVLVHVVLRHCGKPFCWMDTA